MVRDRDEEGRREDVGTHSESQEVFHNSLEGSAGTWGSKTGVLSWDPGQWGFTE